MKLNSALIASLVPLILPLVLPGATITIETTCQPAQQPAFTTNNGCSVPRVPPTQGNVGGGAVTATGSASFALAPTVDDWNIFRVYAEASAEPLDANTQEHPTRVYTTEGFSQVTLSTVLTTTGPGRSAPALFVSKPVVMVFIREAAAIQDL